MGVRRKERWNECLIDPIFSVMWHKSKGPDLSFAKFASSSWQGFINRTAVFSCCLSSTSLHLDSLHLVFVPVEATSQRKRSTYLPAIITFQINTFGHSSSSLSFWSLGNSLKVEEEKKIISYYPFFIFIHVFILWLLNAAFKRCMQMLLLEIFLRILYDLWSDFS